MSDPSRQAAAEEALRTVFGFESFRPGQWEIIEEVLGGGDVLAIMPTGSGKSLCYQLPALLGDGLTLVVSPLIALMRDQVAALRHLGVAAASLNSSMHPTANQETLDDAAAERLKLLYVAPERLLRPDTLAALKRARVARLAVDEAHCISQWGHDFRPEYLRLGELAGELGGVPVVAFTATADMATRSDIAEKLFRRKPRFFIHGFDRPNLRLAMRPKASSGKQIAEFVLAHAGQSGIVYCPTRALTFETAQSLAAKGVKALPYHAGMSAADRAKHQDAFLQEDGVVIAATIAFGMGIDKPDVRFVCHAGMPGSIEAYYQEIGRAGRDGLPADTLTLYGLDDIRLRRQQIEESEATDEQKRIERQRLNALVALCEAPRCRRQTLLAYFGEESGPCGNCDLCLDGVETIDGTVLAQKALSAIVRTGERFGTEHLIAVLTGDSTDQVRRFGHDRLPTFGVGADETKPFWRSVFRQLYAVGIISLDMTRFGRCTITEAGREVLRGARSIDLRKDGLRPAAEKRRRAAAAPTAAEPLADIDQPLFERLRAERRRLAAEEGVPAYVVFADRSLIEMAREKPADADAMAGIHGVGAAKLERYGAIFIDAIRRHQAGAAD